MTPVRMRTTAAGPDGVVHAGQVVALAEPQAAELLAMGFADQVGIETAILGPPETAMRRPIRRVAAREVATGAGADSRPIDPGAGRETSNGQA